MKRVLVPLDTTEAAEAVLPLARTLSYGGATVRFLHVAPIPENVIGADGRLMAYSDQESGRTRRSSCTGPRTAARVGERRAVVAGADGVGAPPAARA